MNAGKVNLKFTDAVIAKMNADADFARFVYCVAARLDNGRFRYENGIFTSIDKVCKPQTNEIIIMMSDEATVLGGETVE